MTGLANLLRQGALVLLLGLGGLALFPQLGYRLGHYLPWSQWGGLSMGVGLWGEFWLAPLFPRPVL